MINLSPEHNCETNDLLRPDYLSDPLLGGLGAVTQDYIESQNGESDPKKLGINRQRLAVELARLVEYGDPLERVAAFEEILLLIERKNFH